MRAVGTLLPLLLILMMFAGNAGAGAAGGGVGLAVVPTAEGELVVLKVLAETPAARAGLRPGDLIVQVDERPLRGSAFTEVASGSLWGAAGTSVTLKYRRPGTAGEHAVTLQRTVLPPHAGDLPGMRMLPADSPGGKE